MATEPPVEARFVTTAGGVSDELRVTIESFDGGVHLFGPVVWMPRVGGAGPVLPAAGDFALVQRSVEGRWWVLAWISSS